MFLPSLPSLLRGSRSLLDPDNHQRNGLLGHQCPRSDSSALLCIVHCYHLILVYRRSNPAARSHTDSLICHRRHRIHSPRCLQLSRSPLLWCLPRGLGSVPLHRERPAVGRQWVTSISYLLPHSADRAASTDNQGSDTRRGVGIALLNFIGQCGPLLGTNVFPSSEGPRYVKGQAICAAFIFFNGFLAFGLRCLLKWENKKLDEKYGVPPFQGTNQTGGKESAVSEENYGPSFRYVL